MARSRDCMGTVHDVLYHIIQLQLVNSFLVFLKKMPSTGVLLINGNQLIKGKGFLWEILINILLFPKIFSRQIFEELGLTLVECRKRAGVDKS